MCMPLGQVQNKMLVTLILENFASEGKALWRLNILVSFVPFQERKGRFKDSHLQGSFTVSYAQLNIWPHIRMEREYYWTRKGSQVPECAPSDEFSMGAIKKSLRHTHKHTHICMDTF